MADDQSFYTEQLIENLQYRYGDGLLSPGGTTELALMFAGLDVQGAVGLDFGCGLGGYDVELVRLSGAAHVTGVDVDAKLLAQAEARTVTAGLGTRRRMAGSLGGTGRSRRDPDPGARPPAGGAAR